MFVCLVSSKSAKDVFFALLSFDSEGIEGMVSGLIGESIFGTLAPTKNLDILCSFFLTSVLSSALEFFSSVVVCWSFVELEDSVMPVTTSRT